MRGVRLGIFQKRMGKSYRGKDPASRPNHKQEGKNMGVIHVKHSVAADAGYGNFEVNSLYAFK